MNSPPTDSPEAPTETVSPPADAIEADTRCCLACGYLLRGLGPEPRCPECGLVNIPEEFRRQVWELVDSGKWFFSGFFHPFRKRPPGWWWALDREGDVRRSWRYAVINMLISLVIICAVVFVADGWVFRETQFTVLWLPNDLAGPPTPLGYYQWGSSLMQTRVPEPQEFPYVHVDGIDWTLSSLDSWVTWEWRPSWRSALPATALVAWTWLVWAMPSFAGIGTQIRKGLPAFARAPRTIIAATNYESHRLVFIALLASLFASLFWWLVATHEIAVARVGPLLAPPTALYASAGVPLGLAIFAALGWVGPLRSDYTRQLIQSRRHAARIVLMYACLLPAALVLAAVSSIAALREMW